MPLDAGAVAELRSEFPALQVTTEGRGFVFLDGPGGTQVHGSVIEAMVRAYTDANSNLGGAFLHSRRAEAVVDAARAAMADLLNASCGDEIAFGLNMTSLTFQVSRAVGRTLTPGDEVVVTRLDHDANIAPWRALEEAGVIVRHVDFVPGDCTLDMCGLEATIGPRTRLVAVGYASNAVGTINDVQRIVALAHAAGALVYVDAVHYVPHATVDVRALGCDMLVCSAYKFYGPHVGVLWGRYDLLDRLPAYKVRPAGDQPPDKFETGTQSFEALAGVTAAVDYLASVGRRYGDLSGPEAKACSRRRQELEAAMAAIRVYEMDQCRLLVNGLREIPGLKIHGITDPARFDERVPTVSFTMQGISPAEIASRLAEANVYVWDGNFYAVSVTERLGLEKEGGLLRVGLSHYTTREEVLKLLGLLADLPR